MLKGEGTRKPRILFETFNKVFCPTANNTFLTHINKTNVIKSITFLASAAVLSAICLMLFDNCPSQSKDKKSPTIIWFNKVISFTTQVPWLLEERNISCAGAKCIMNGKIKEFGKPEAYLFYAPTIDRVPLPRYPETIWGWFYDESAIDRMMFLYDRGLELFNFSASFNRNSDVPFPLNWFRGLKNVTSLEYYVNTSMKNDLLSELAPVLYMQTDCDTFTDRDLYVKSLMKYIKIDSYGDCLHNKELPVDKEFYKNRNSNYVYRWHMYTDYIMEFVARYKFVIAIENSICNDYVTEKFWRAIELGVVPIYYGSPLIRDWLPNNKSAILLEDFPTPELLSRHLHYLLSNDTAYEEYLKHKTLGIITNKKLIEEVKARPYQLDLGEQVKEFECFICKKLHNMNSGSVNVVTKKHYECQMPTSALNLSLAPNSPWVEFIKEAESTIEGLIDDINGPSHLQRKSANSCIDNIFLRRMFGFVTERKLSIDDYDAVTVTSTQPAEDFKQLFNDIIFTRMETVHPPIHYYTVDSS